eukprot:CAMPEP_0197055610 /NCGR_PEP_ID=MMETSP1384-20130603/69450_1 /TAXON_ID=29189 /ORGANISM="Ammonia sp." /LENGTH=372 /DNA_ID=CAMNT_0042489241 /DNA_START=80 /DNA_END=1195 /DNA_ORIENTATION=+
MADSVRVSLLIVVIGISLAIFSQFGGVNEIHESLANALETYGNELLVRGYIPDFLLRIAIRLQLQQRLTELEARYIAERRSQLIEEFVADLKNRSLTAEETQAANEQHYEVDTSFYEQVLGRYKKYSSTIYLSDEQKASRVYDQEPSISLSTALSLLNESEIDMMEIYIERLELCTGNECTLKLLDLGCGWGSFSLYYASRCANCEIVAISNSESQVAYINSFGVANVRAIRQNVNELDAFAQSIGITFDRVLSIEMFEHMKNYKVLLQSVRKLLHCDGKLFVHMFVHNDKPYHFESGWMTRYFFTGGTMLSYELLPAFNDDFVAQHAWKVNGIHYSFTLESWLHLMDANEVSVKAAIGNIYGNHTATVTQW